MIDEPKVRITSGTSIVGVVSCVPEINVGNDYFLDRFSSEEISDVSKMTGVQSRRRAPNGVRTEDLCFAAANTLLDKLGWERSSVDAIIFMSQTPSHVLPATACKLQSQLELSSSCIAFDVNLGCSAYPYGVWLCSSLINGESLKRVLLLVGDTISSISDPNDRATAMLFGDAGTATAIEYTDSSSESVFVLGSDGSGAANLIVPNSPIYGNVSLDTRLKERDMDKLYMDGGAIFNFTLKRVPALVNSLLTAANGSLDEFDGFLFHQANKFMLNHLCKKSRLPLDKVPMNIEEFGNTSSASIPLLMTTRMQSELSQRRNHIAMFGFGVGYSWGAASVDIGPLKCVETIEL
ncbi:ketoacyl-ACP synthase III [Pseudidiomarina aquimaris]|uniref:ketoacyl-ACP synthase III n=1 Tax=Pseudidiomarina aquimaris TaxID=641841 RepID=UPI0018E4F457|nr:ketoacyl-ACP synthase III [Pseudidiomarina aquimaris]